jgi:ABC-type lipoprotein export system ATPase subunit
MDEIKTTILGIKTDTLKPTEKSFVIKLQQLAQLNHDSRELQSLFELYTQLLQSSHLLEQLKRDTLLQKVLSDMDK